MGVLVIVHSTINGKWRSWQSARARVKVTCFMADPGAFGTLNALFEEFFPGSPPARSVPVVSRPRGLLFSIEAIGVFERTG